MAPPDITDGTVYFDNATRTQRVYRDPKIRRGLIERLWIRLIDFLR